MSVLVTDGNQRATLAVVRALGKIGVEVTVGETEKPSLASSSRFCARSVRYPSPLTSPEDFAEAVSAELCRGRYRVFLPMTDVTCRIASDVRVRVPEVTVPLPPAEVVVRVQDKGAVLEAAREAGISCPRTYLPGSLQELQNLAGKLEYPVVVKPRFSVYRVQECWLRTHVEYARTPQELISKYQNAARQLPRPLIQELVSGDGLGVFLLLWNGELKAAMCHRRIREKPPSGGVSVLRESIRLDEKLVSASTQLLQRLGWQGVAMVEFKGREAPRLMEINGRFWGSLQLAVDAGMNFPAMLYRLCCGESIAPNFDYRVGVKSRWLAGDLDHLLLRFRNGHTVSHELPSRTRAALEFLRFGDSNTLFELERPDDLGPACFEWKRYVGQVLGRLRNQKVAF
jgi:predicted ATP-grasp superfamily ATP-dependent carboligase